MKKQNFFTLGLESIAGTVGPEDVTNQSTMQPKPGIGKGDEVDSVEKPKKEFGEDHDLTDNDDIDTVAESQEHTLALEYLHQSVGRFMRVASALEELTEQVENRLEADEPLGSGETAMITTALDASGVGEPLSESVGLESYGFSPRIATESFVETLKERTGKVTQALAKFSKRIGDELSVRFSTFAAAMEKYPDARIKPLKKKIAATEGYAGRNFNNAKKEKAIQGKIFAPSSSKNPLAALRDALAAYDSAATFIDGRVVTSMAQAGRAFSTEPADKVVTATNKLLATVTELSKTHSLNSKFTTIHVDAGVKALTPENAGKISTNSFKRTPVKSSYDNSLKIASASDLDELQSLVAKASRVFGAKVSEIKSFYYNLPAMKERTLVGAIMKVAGARTPVAGEKLWSEVKLNAAHRYAFYCTTYTVSSVELGLAEAVFRNAVAAAEWISASIAEANAMKKAS